MANELTDLSTWLDEDSDFPTTQAPNIADPTASAEAFIGDAEAILQINTNADEGIKDLVAAYQSERWDDPERALKIVEDYANKLRQKDPNRENLLDLNEALEIAPIKPEDVGFDIARYEEENLAQVAGGDSPDPLVRAYQSQIVKGIEDVATAGYQEANTLADNSVLMDKVDRAGLGAVAGIVKAFGFEKDVERQLRADSNDTFASAVASGVGSILALPITIPNTIINAGAFGYEQYEETRAAGGSIGSALTAASIEGANQAIDVVLDKLILAKPLKKGTGIFRSVATRAVAEGSQEVAQNRVTEYADFVGLDKSQRNLIPFAGENFQEDLYAAGAGALIGGGAQIAERTVPGLISRRRQQPDTGPAPEVEQTAPGVEQTTQAAPSGPAAITDDIASLGERLGLSRIRPFPETEPPNRVAVVGEPVAGNAPVETVESAEQPQSLDRDTAVAITDADEAFMAGEDGTTVRVLDGAKKQAHTDAVIIEPEVAEKIATLQATQITPDGAPVSPETGTEVNPIKIQKDDLGRPYIQHPNVTPDLTIDTTTRNTDPVMIPVADTPTGHVLQFSERPTVFGSIENRASVSKGKVTTLSPTQTRKEISTADKLRATPKLNDNVKRLLELDKNASDDLSYIADTNEGNLARVNEVFAEYDNNYLAFANAISSRPFGEITPHEALAADFAAEALSAKANAIRETDAATADLYDTLAADMVVASTAKGSEAGQALQLRSLTPFTANTLLLNARMQINSVAAAKAAAESGRSLAEVKNITQEDAQLDVIEQGLVEREASLQEAAKIAQERHDAPDREIAELEQEAVRLETAPSPEVTAIDEQIRDLDRAEKVRVEEEQAAAEDLQKQQDALEEQAVAADKQADDLENAVEEADTKVQDLENEIAAKEKELQDLINKKLDEPDTKELKELEQKKKDLGCK
jgi:hypothetical protein